MLKTIKKLLITGASLVMIAGIGATANNTNVQAHHRTHRAYHASYRGIPKAIRGHYASYRYIRGHIRHGERNLINLNRSYVSVMPKGAPDPFGLSNVYTRKIGYGKYVISGKVVSVGSQGHANLTITKHGHQAYIRCSYKLGGGRMNGSYYSSCYTHAFRVLNGEV